MLSRHHALWLIVLLAGLLGSACNSLENLGSPDGGSADTSEDADGAAGDTATDTQDRDETGTDVHDRDESATDTQAAGDTATDTEDGHDTADQTSSDATNGDAHDAQALCGSTVCASYQTCESATCIMGDWWFVATRFEPNADPPMITTRGALRFDDLTHFTVTEWTDSQDDSGGFLPSDQGTVTIDPNGGLTLTQNGVTWQGQIAEDGQLLYAVSHDPNTNFMAQAVWLRRGGTHSLASVNDAEWRVIGYRGIVYPRHFADVQGTVSISDTNAVSGLIVDQSLGPYPVSNQTLPIRVESNGTFRLYHTQNGSVPMQFFGYLSEDSQIAVMTRIDVLDRFYPGMLVLMKTSDGATDALLDGTYALGHLRYDSGGPGTLLFGAVPFDGNGRIGQSTGALDVLNDTAPPFDLTGTDYMVEDNGAFATRVVDGAGVATNASGQVEPVPAGLSAPRLLVSYATQSYSTHGDTFTGSLMLWVRRF